MSVKSENIMMEPNIFSSEEETLDLKLQIVKAESLDPSCDSVKSEEVPPEFSHERLSSDLSLQTVKAEPLESCVYEEQQLSASPSLPRLQIIKVESLVPSCVSVVLPPDFSNEITVSDMSLQTIKAEPLELCVSEEQQPNVSPSSPQRLQSIKAEPLEPSCVSAKSENAVFLPPELNSKRLRSDMSSGGDGLLQDQSMCGVCEQIQTDPVSINCGHIFCRLCFRTLWDQSVHSGDLTCPCCRKRFKTYPLQLTPKEESMELDEHKPADDILLSISERNKISLKNKYKGIFERLITQGNKILTRRVYTQLYITEGEREGLNEEHEDLQIENKPWKQHSPCTPIHFLEIFNPVQCAMGEMEEGNIIPLTVREETKEDKDPQLKNLRSVLTKGIAGIGKTVSVQKFILDWAEGEANQDIEFMFVLPFQELNLIKDNQYSLHGLLCDLHPELRGLDTKEYDVCKTMFIFDGLDESRIPLKFSECEKVSDVTKVSSVDVLITNLIRGDLLPSAHIWITSRPAAANQIPSQYISRVTEIQGFNDPQKEEYFRKRISDQHQADSVISHIKTTRSLHIMCHIPVFCWISATVLQRIMKQGTTGIPKTLTAMYSHFLCTQTIMRKEKCLKQQGRGTKKELLKSNRNMFLKLSELAFKQLMKGNVMFYEDDLRECGIDVTEASVYSGICTEIFREESVLHQRKVYCFVHLSFQEFLAAFYVFHCYVNKNMKDLHFLKPRSMKPFESVTLEGLLKRAVRTALKSKTGHLDLFLRFLLGISLESNQHLLQDLLTHTVSSSESMKKTIQYIERMIQTEDLPSDRSINLFLCLTEMNHFSSFSKIQEDFKSEKHPNTLSTGECLVLAYMVLNSDKVLDELDLTNYNTNEKGYWRLIPAVRNCKKAVLPNCNLSMNCYETLCSTLKSPNSILKELDLSNTDLQDSGLQLIFQALKSSNCELEILRLSGCNLSINSYEKLCSALKSQNSTLKVLELNNTDLHDSGVELISEALKSSDCKLTLRLTDCKFSLYSYETLCSALKSPISPLKEPVLSDRDLRYSRVKSISEGRERSKCKLEIVGLNGYKLTMNSCEVHFSALKSSRSSLKVLDFSDTELHESEVKLISDGLKGSNCKVEMLRLARCKLSMNSYECLCSALKSPNSHLKKLELVNIHLQDSKVKLISEALKSSNCKLEVLRLTDCKFTLKSYETLCSALNSPNSPLKEPDLSQSDLQVSGVKLTSEGPKASNCALEIISLQTTNPTMEHKRKCTGLEALALLNSLDDCESDGGEELSLAIEDSDTESTEDSCTTDDESSSPPQKKRLKRQTDNTAPKLTAKDGTVWEEMGKNAHIVESVPKLTFCETAGPTEHARRRIKSRLQSFQSLIDFEMLRIITFCTVHEACKEDRSWTFSISELMAFMAVLLLRATLCGVGTMAECWSERYAVPAIKDTMSHDRYREIMRYLRFDYKDTRAERVKTDRFAAISDIWQRFIHNCQLCYKPGKHITVDEQLYPTKVRCPFLQYAATKPDKFGIKFWAVTDLKTKYMCNATPYLGKDPSQPKGERLSENVVMKLVEPFLGKGRTVTTGKFFTSVSLANRLLEQRTTLLGTINTISREIPPPAKNAKGRQEFSTHVYKSGSATLTVYAPRKNKLVCILSTMHQQVQIVNGHKRKPNTVTDYNHMKSGVDMDQMVRAYSVRAGTCRWPVAVFYNMLDLAVMNSHILYKTCTGSTESRRDFVHGLADELRQFFLEKKAMKAKLNPPLGLGKKRQCQVQKHCNRNHSTERCEVCDKYTCRKCRKEGPWVCSKC
ncbi:uncharacterized protein [Hoplias malabaricus]|uniref:uncharacterized protein n=1 Tax=Hoplias malabaricus TaxID=27720 RepID=UPI00346383B7